ncbi:MAG: hypothetical protein LBT09_12835 [Planctomycetaceae bacterium]|jgi:hypothetical protein|nr:hypothetical protein [Planctomycetaceae bacterium]
MLNNMLEKSFNIQVDFQTGLIISLAFFVFSLLLLWFNRGIAMQCALLVSFLAYLSLCIPVDKDTATHVSVTVFVYFMIWVFMVNRYIKALVKKQLEREWEFYSSDYETTLADPFEFTWLDLDYYDTKQHQLELLGFRKVHDIELLHQTRVFPETRTFTRELINADRDIGTDVIHLRFVKPKNRYERNFDIRYIIFVTEFSDGTFLETNNTKGVNPILEIDGITIQMFEPNTPLEKLLNAHNDTIESICEMRNVVTVFHQTDQELFEFAKRGFALFCKDRQKKGGLLTKTKDAQNTIILTNGNDENNAGVEMFLSEYVKQTQKITQKQQEKQNNENE